MKAKQILVIFSLLISLFSFSQKNADGPKNTEFSKENFPNDLKGLKEAQKLIGKGDDFYHRGKTWYKQALEPYLKANEFNPDNAELNFKIGTCYLSSYTKLKSIPFLEKAQKLNF